MNVVAVYSVKEAIRNSSKFNHNYDIVAASSRFPDMYPLYSRTCIVGNHCICLDKRKTVRSSLDLGPLDVGILWFLLELRIRQ